MATKETVDFVNPSDLESKDFWADVKAVCEKHSMVLGTGFNIQKAVKLEAVDKKDVA